MREIVLDTETTGLSHKTGHKIIEIGCVEVLNRVETGNVFHVYINPEREIPYASTKIHGITNEQVVDKPTFAVIADSFLEFIGDSKLIIHNASFDIGFLNYELEIIKRNKLSSKNVLDTLTLARKKFPGASATLDALCKRFDISLRKRRYHGALLDSQLLARVYLELTYEKQSKISFIVNNKSHIRKKALEIREHLPTTEEVGFHKKFLTKIQNPLWKKMI